MNNLLLQIRASLLLVFLIFLSACGGQQTRTLSSLNEGEREIITEEDVVIDPLTFDQVRDEYNTLLDIFEEEKLKEQIERRIADVHMIEGDYRLSTEDEYDGIYDGAKQAYLNLLEKYPDSPENAKILYQLSKAYDSEADYDSALKILTQLTSEYPDYQYIAEAWFRKGDIHFNNTEYNLAENAYVSVVNEGESKYRLNAQYMLGWAYYKQLFFNRSVTAFSVVLADVFGENSEIESLNKNQKVLAEDTLHSLSLSLDKLDAEKSIESFSELHNKPYVWLVYDDLGDYYLEKERYEDSASAYRRFTDIYPFSVKSPLLHDHIIQAYVEGKFFRQSLVEKENYVDKFGLYSEYTVQRGKLGEEVFSSLRTYLDELSSYYHNDAQSQRALVEAEKSKDEALRNNEIIQKSSVQAIKQFDIAIDYYSEFTDTFSSDEKVDEIYFLKAEALYSAYRYAEAAVDYERVAYASIGESANGKYNDAGYAAVISHNNHIEDLINGSNYLGRLSSPALGDESQKVKNYKEVASESMLRFVDVYHQDDRAVSVMSNVADYLLDTKQYEKVVAYTGKLLTDHSGLSRNLQKTVLGIRALAYFNLEEYQNAEINYLAQLELVEPLSEEYKAVSERLAIAIYKKAQVLADNQQNTIAIEEFLKIKRLVPDTKVRVPAQYDAATLLIEESKWSRAIAELEELDANFKGHELAVGFPRKLAFAYEKDEQWLKAADMYRRLASDDPDVTIRREGQYLSGMIYVKAEKFAASTQQLEVYVDLYEEPFDDYLEALHRLALNADLNNNLAKKNQWVLRSIEKEAENPKPSDRSRWIAAWSNIQYANYLHTLFDTFALSQPIAESAIIKNQRLQEALAYYQVASEYGFQEFSTESSFQIGELYSEFANSLIKLPPSSELSQDDQVLYKEIIAEQALPFYDQSRLVHQVNISRAWQGYYNEWIIKSYEAMRLLSPDRFNKEEVSVGVEYEVW